MKKIILAVAVSALAGSAMAQSANSGSASQAASDAGAMAQTGAITFEAAEQRGSQRLHTTPHVYAPPSMFGAGSCGRSNTGSIAVTGFGFGGSVAADDPACNARLDTAVAAQLGMMDVAKLRFFCYGIPENKEAFLAAGNECPEQAREASALYSGDDPIVRARLGID